MVLKDNLVAYYKLDESSGDAADSVGSNTLTNSNVTYVASKIKKGGAFNGSSSTLYKSSFSSGITNVVTISCWVKITDSTTQRVVLSFGKDAGGSGIALFAYGFSTLNYKFFFEFGSGSGRVLTTTTPSVDTWYHLAVTADGTNIKIYLNGLLENTVGTAGSVASSGAAISLGSLLSSNTPPAPTTYYHNGGLDEVGIWSRALSAAEILALYNAYLGTQFPFNKEASFLLNFI